MPKLVGRYASVSEGTTCAELAFLLAISENYGECSLLVVLVLAVRSARL